MATLDCLYKWVIEWIGLGAWFKTLIHTGMQTSDSTDSFKKWFVQEWNQSVFMSKSLIHSGTPRICVAWRQAAVHSTVAQIGTIFIAKELPRNVNRSQCQFQLERKSLPLGAYAPPPPTWSSYLIPTWLLVAVSIERLPPSKEGQTERC